MQSSAAEDDSRSSSDISECPANGESDPQLDSQKNEMSTRSVDVNLIHSVDLFDVPIVALNIDGRLRLCLAQISSTLLKSFSYNEIHNRRVALGINCVQCTPVQLELLRRAGAMPISSRRCGMITKREAERLVKSFLCEAKPPALPEDFAFHIQHFCGWGCKGRFVPSRYNSSRAKCVQCSVCQQYFSPNKFIFHSHKLPDSSFSPADAANFNSWRRHIHLCAEGLPENIVHAWEDVKAMFNGGSRRRVLSPSMSKGLSPRKQMRPLPPDNSPPPSSTHVPLTVKVAPQPTLLPQHACAPAPPFQPPFLPTPAYDWMYGQHPFSMAPYSFWMQRALQMQQSRCQEFWPSWPSGDHRLGEWKREDPPEPGK